MDCRKLNRLKKIGNKDEITKAYFMMKEKLETELRELRNSRNAEKQKISFQNLLENVEPCNSHEISLPLTLPTLTFKKNMRSSDVGYKVGFKKMKILYFLFKPGVSLKNLLLNQN